MIPPRREASRVHLRDQPGVAEVPRPQHPLREIAGPDILLRPYTPADAEPLYQLDRICFTEPFRFTRRQLRTSAERPSAIARIATEHGEIVGFVIAQIQRSRQSAHAYIDTLDVAPAARRRGIATDLLADLERLCRLAGATRIMLHVHVGNPAAIRFYEKHGFERLILEPNFYGESSDGSLDAAVYTRQLVPPL
jgi:ribosomal-protein-alanine N-acetyltransferase